MKAAESIIERLSWTVREIYNRPEGFIPLHAPLFGGQESRYVQDCLNSGWVSYLGEYVSRFERMICDFTGCTHAVATVSGTAALHMALIFAGVEPEDEVLCPAFSFAATASAIVYCGAYPVFMDVDPGTLGIDGDKVLRFLKERSVRKKDGFAYNRRTGRRIKACIPMHTYGFPVEMNHLLTLCEEYGIAVVEDAAEALGSSYNEKHCGTLGMVGILSFNGNKIITTGGGGMILTDDKRIGEKARHLTTTAKVSHPWEFHHDEVGYNYRMPNINAALGCAQVERLPELLAWKRNQADRFRSILAEENSIRTVQPETGMGNHWFNLVEIDPACREAVLKGLNEAEIQARASWTPLCNMHPYLKYERFEIEEADRLFYSMICLPNGVMKQPFRHEHFIEERFRYHPLKWGSV